MLSDEILERLAIIDVTQLRLDAVQRLQEAGVLGAALGRRQVQVDRVREDEQTEVVLKRLADVRQHQHGVDGVIELGQRADAGGHHAADVQAKDDVLAVFALEDAVIGLLRARGRLPADVAVIVVAACSRGNG